MITRKFQANKKWRKLFVAPSTTRLFAKIVSALLLLLFSFPTLAETSFTYQGRLSQSGEPANGIYDMRFNLFDAVTAGSLIGPTVNQTGVKVLDGVFNVMLDFGEAPFGSDPRWLRIEVKEAGGGTFVALFPRQRVGASPFAIETLSVAAGAVDTAALQNNAVTTAQIENGTILPEDLAGGVLLTDKTQFVRVVGEVVVAPANTTRESSAYCPDSNDIPISPGCEVNPSSHSVELREMKLIDWDVNERPAGVTCEFRNNGDSAASVQSVIICLPKP